MPNDPVNINELAEARNEIAELRAELAEANSHITHLAGLIRSEQTAPPARASTTDELRQLARNLAATSETVAAQAVSDAADNIEQLTRVSESAYHAIASVLAVRDGITNEALQRVCDAIGKAVAIPSGLRTARPSAAEPEAPNRCVMCGYIIAATEKICGECACEDDGW